MLQVAKLYSAMALGCDGFCITLKSTAGRDSNVLASSVISANIDSEMEQAFKHASTPPSSLNYSICSNSSILTSHIWISAHNFCAPLMDAKRFQTQRHNAASTHFQVSSSFYSIQTRKNTVTQFQGRWLLCLWWKAMQIEKIWPWPWEECRSQCCASAPRSAVATQVFPCTTLFPLNQDNETISSQGNKRILFIFGL